MEQSQVTAFHLRYVSTHINQTSLVNDLLQKGFLCYDEIFCENTPPEDSPEIYQWLAFPNFRYDDFQRLIKAGIPVLESDHESWVGITSFGSHYNLYVYPELISTLFEIECSYQDIEAI